jgi:hypothetical protein
MFPSALEQKSIARNGLVAPLLFAAGFLSTARHFSTGQLGRGFEAIEIARNLAAHGAFANPFAALPTGPSALCPPLFPAFIALILRLLGFSGVSALVVATCSIVMHGLHAALLPYISEDFFDDRRPGICAAVISIVFPIFYFFPQFEIMYVAVGLMAFCLASRRFARVADGRRGLGCGVLLGLLALLNPAAVCVAVIWLVFVVWVDSSKTRWSFPLGIVLGAALALTPWTIRNYVTFHELIPIRDNLGLELYIANHDLAKPSFLLNSQNQVLNHPNLSIKEALAVREMGEAQYSHNRGALAMAWIASHRGQFLKLSATRARMFWFSEPLDSPLHRWSVAGTSILSFLALLLLAIRRQRIAIFFAVVWLVYPLLYYCVQHDVRYRVPILWLTLLGAGYLLSSLWDLATAIFQHPSTARPARGLLPASVAAIFQWAGLQCGSDR